MLEPLKQNEIWAIFVNSSVPDNRGIETIGRLTVAAARYTHSRTRPGADESGLAFEALRRGAKTTSLRMSLLGIHSSVPRGIWQSGRAFRHYAEELRHQRELAVCCLVIQEMQFRKATIV